MTTQEQREANVKRLRPRKVAAPAAAPRPQDEVPIDQQLADAFNANNAVLTYVLATTGSTLPVISPAPAGYQDFIKAFSDAKVHALAWPNTVVPLLIGIPQSIVGYATLYNLNMININQALNILRQNPRDPNARRTVLAGLQNLQKGISAQLNGAMDVQTNVGTFASNLTADAAAMQKAIELAVKTQGVDQGKIDDLMNAIESLKDEIATLNAVVTVGAISAGVLFFAGAVIAIFTFGAGLAIGIIGAAAGITAVIVAQEMIKSLSAKIAADQVQLSDLNQQVAALKLLQSNLQTLIRLSGPASEQVDLIVRAWRQLEAELKAVISDIVKAEGDLSALDLEALQADLNQGDADFAIVQSFASTVAKIRYLEAAPATVTLPTTPAAQAA
jgi:hypothetical protein